MAAVPPKEVTRDNEREAWLLRKQGWTQERIAGRLGLSQQAVCTMLARIEKKLAAEFRDQAEEIKARQTALLETLADEVLTQWRRSCEEAFTEVTVKGKTTGGKGKSGAENDQSKAQITTTREAQSGNPALIAQARGTLADIRDIWGLDAPKKNEHTGAAGEPLSTVTEVIVHLQREPEEVSEAGQPMAD